MVSNDRDSARVKLASDKIGGFLEAFQTRIHKTWTMKWCLVMLILAGVTRADNSVESKYMNFRCPQLNSQEEIDLNAIMGKWYVVEVLEHKVDPLKPLSGSYVVNSCPIVKLRAIENAAKFFSSLRLLWSEEMGNLEYTFRIPDITRKPGFWISDSQQNGTLVQKQYSQFTGNVYVMKAVASDMVLTFCAGSPDNQLYSLLLAREHILSKSDKRGVHNLLVRRGLKIVNIRETCMNSAAFRRASINLIGLLGLMGVLFNALFGSW
ncbi:uncharacterized protein LOC114874200 [Osmia bicornis bicornis]|uniref:uncharacterized protein LOC114874200 n=1 Tax=Osmia bicornis bicornis TaxID=1437191 RepID=UPI0010F6729D|nr:uncharacterized protein LOC114874200 [Osmia bicornis bicornis]